MNTFFLAWAISAFVLLIVAIGLGVSVGQGWLGFAIDRRGRYSLTQLQLALWTIVLISLFGAFFVARLAVGIDDPLEFSIPSELLVILGISVGSTVTASVVKAGKDSADPQRIAASNREDRPRFSQIFLVEEGELADKIVDVTKFQNFWITVLVLAAYVALVIDAMMAAGAVSEFALPGFHGTFLTLVGISHAGYVAGKMAAHPGQPQGLTVALRRARAVPEPATAVRATTGRPTYVPRNPG